MILNKRFILLLIIIVIAAFLITYFFEIPYLSDFTNTYVKPPVDNFIGWINPQIENVKTQLTSNPAAFLGVLATGATAVVGFIGNKLKSLQIQRENNRVKELETQNRQLADTVTRLVSESNEQNSLLQKFEVENTQLRTELGYAQPLKTAQDTITSQSSAIQTLNTQLRSDAQKIHDQTNLLQTSTLQNQSLIDSVTKFKTDAENKLAEIQTTFNKQLAEITEAKNQAEQTYTGIIDTYKSKYETLTSKYRDLERRYTEQQT